MTWAVNQPQYRIDESRYEGGIEPEDPPAKPEPVPSPTPRPIAKPIEHSNSQPNPPPPPEPEPPVTHGFTGFYADWVQCMSREYRKLLAKYNPEFEPPRHWLIHWQNEFAILLSEMLNRYDGLRGQGWRVTQIYVLAASKHPGEYPSPSRILGDLDKLQAEIASLEAAGQWEAIWKEYLALLSD